MERETAEQIMSRLPVAHVDALFVPAKKYASYQLISIYSAIAHITLPGDYAEFGVYKGRTARFLSNFVFRSAPRTLHLFDSFEGLPETRDALDPLNGKIAPGTVILFDEYFLDGQDDEHRAPMGLGGKIRAQVRASMANAALPSGRKGNALTGPRSR